MQSSNKPCARRYRLATIAVVAEVVRQTPERAYLVQRSLELFIRGEEGAYFSSSAVEGGLVAERVSVAASKDVDGYHAGASSDSLLKFERCCADLLPVNT